MSAVATIQLHSLTVNPGGARGIINAAGWIADVAWHSWGAAFTSALNSPRAIGMRLTEPLGVAAEWTVRQYAVG